MASCYHITKLILRVAQVIFALIAFATAGWLLDTGATGSSDFGLLKQSSVSFMVFTGVLAFLISLVYSISFCVPRMQSALWGLVEVVINALWVVFWLAAAAAFAAEPACKPSSVYTGNQICNAFLASQAFAWLSWFLWIASLIFSILDWRSGEGVGGGKRYPMGSAPQSSVQM